MGCCMIPKAKKEKTMHSLPYDLKWSCHSPETATLRGCLTWRILVTMGTERNAQPDPSHSKLAAATACIQLRKRLKWEHFIQAFPKFLFQRIYVVIKFGSGLLRRYTGWNRFWPWDLGCNPKNPQMCDIRFGAEWQAEVGRTLNGLSVSKIKAFRKVLGEDLL